jgi:hypothetical protein
MKNIKSYYLGDNGKRRKYGIFAPGVDRFILIDQLDYWITLQTAEILSSKLPTMAYILPPHELSISNQDCILYTIENKTSQKVGWSPMVAGRQHPILKFLGRDHNLVNEGIPEDYKDNFEILEKIMAYAQYVQQVVYALNIADASSNIRNTSKFVNNYIDDSWVENIGSTSDGSEMKKGVFFEIKKILYLSNSPEEAESKIHNFWKNNIADQGFVVHTYYHMLNVPTPDDIKELIEQGPKNLSTYLF